jgi:hypothetical protein
MRFVVQYCIWCNIGLPQGCTLRQGSQQPGLLQLHYLAPGLGVLYASPHSTRTYIEVLTQSELLRSAVYFNDLMLPKLLYPREL